MHILKPYPSLLDSKSIGALYRLKEETIPPKSTRNFNKFLNSSSSGSIKIWNFCLGGGPAGSTYLISKEVWFLVIVYIGSSNTQAYDPFI